MLRVLTFPFRLAWWIVRVCLGTLSLTFRGLLWLIGSRLFLLVPLAVFFIPLMEGQNVPAEAFYPLFIGSIVLHFLARALWTRLPAKRLRAPKLVIPKPPVAIVQPTRPAPQPIVATPQPVTIIPKPAPVPAPRRQAAAKPQPNPLEQTRFPPFSPVKQLLRPMNPQHSPTPSYALSRLPEAVRRIFTSNP